MNNQRLFFLAVSFLGLSACNNVETSSRYADGSYMGYYDPSERPDLPYVPSAAVYSYESTIDYQSPPVEEHVVTIPDSYHVGSMRAPVSHHDRDKTWVNTQNPNSYTIELINSPKASDVAKRLMQAPKKSAWLKFNMIVQVIVITKVYMVRIRIMRLLKKLWIPYPIA